MCPGFFVAPELHEAARGSEAGLFDRFRRTVLFDEQELVVGFERFFVAALHLLQNPCLFERGFSVLGRLLLRLWLRLVFFNLFQRISAPRKTCARGNTHQATQNFIRETEHDLHLQQRLLSPA